MSTTGVPSIASSGPTASSRPSIPSTVTSCSPAGSDDPTSASRRRRSAAATRRHADAPGGRSDPPRAATSRARAVARGIPWSASAYGRLQDDPRVGCSLAALARRVRPISERRADDADRLQRIAVVRHAPATSAAPRASGCPKDHGSRHRRRTAARSAPAGTRRRDPSAPRTSPGRRPWRRRARSRRPWRRAS